MQFFVCIILHFINVRKDLIRKEKMLGHIADIQNNVVLSVH